MLKTYFCVIIYLDFNNISIRILIPFSFGEGLGVRPVLFMKLRNPQEIKHDDLDSNSKGVLNIFENIHTEVQVARLKRLIMRDAYWNGRVVETRKKINSKVDASGSMPNNPELLALYKELCEEGLVLNKDGSQIVKDNKVEQILKRLKVRSNSGVAVISLLTKPYTCPGRCIYCPTEKNMPKSYLSREPAAARALLNRFDPYKQIWMRLRALTMNGHPLDKIEMIFIGGTWNFYDKEYQEYFTKESFRACNNWKALEEGREVISEDHNYTLEELQIINESAHARIIGLSIETRPDYIIPEELKWLRFLGVTKVELGVQHLDNGVLDYNKREMTAESIALGTEMLRNYGFKVVYHMMPNLPTSNPVMDVEMFKNLYNGLDHHPDMMKIYPCMVLRGSLLYKWVTQRKIEYEAYDDTTLTRVLADAESFVPNYTRLIRVIRDIPADYIIIGSKKSNLREDVDKFQKARRVPQVDIRAREIRDAEIDPADFELTLTWYETRDGYECFLQFENKKDLQEGEASKLAGFLRLRLPKGKMQTPSALQAPSPGEGLNTNPNPFRLAGTFPKGRTLSQECKCISKSDKLKDYILPYNKELLCKAKENRKKMTKSELDFWDYIKEDKLSHDFTRQKVIGNYIIDFYSTELKMAIEIDGEYHNQDGNIERDKERTEFLVEQNIKVIRFKNEEVRSLDLELLKNLLDERKAELGKLKVCSCAVPSPSLGEGAEGGRGLSFVSAPNWGLKNWYTSCVNFYNERLSKTSSGEIDDVLESSALVRELHVYGTMKRVGEEGNQSQHTGMGKRLLARAEEIARGDNKYNLKYKKLTIISGVGVREYYRKRGYDLKGTYMVKELR